MALYMTKTGKPTVFKKIVLKVYLYINIDTESTDSQIKQKHTSLVTNKCV